MCCATVDADVCCPNMYMVSMDRCRGSTVMVVVAVIAAMTLSLMVRMVSSIYNREVVTMWMGMRFVSMNSNSSSEKYSFRDTDLPSTSPKNT